MAKIEIINWEILQKMCKFFHESFDNYGSGEWENTCHHRLNTPEGHSWGECNYKYCPFKDFILR